MTTFASQAGHMIYWASLMKTPSTSVPRLVSHGANTIAGGISTPHTCTPLMDEVRDSALLYGMGWEGY